MGGIGIYDANELPGDSQKRIERFRKWLLETIPVDVLKEHCELHGKKLNWDEAARGLIEHHKEQKHLADGWVEHKQKTIEDLREVNEELQGRRVELEAFVKDVLLELPVEFFERGKTLLGLGPDDGPRRPLGASDAFRDAMIGARAALDQKDGLERARVFTEMMSAIARMHLAEATDRSSRMAEKSLARITAETTEVTNLARKLDPKS